MKPFGALYLIQNGLEFQKHDTFIDLKELNGCGAVGFSINGFFYLFESLFPIYVKRNINYNEFHVESCGEVFYFHPLKSI